MQANIDAPENLELSGAETKPRVIATEEAWATREYIAAFLAAAPSHPSSGIASAAMILSREAIPRLLCDIDVRLATMDANGVDMQLISLTSPGVQIFDARVGTDLAIKVNDRMAEMVREYPRRFAGLASVAPQDPAAAAREVGRAMSELGLNGIIINSHTNGEFLDDPKFYPIFEAAQQHKAAIYLHPTFPPESMIGPFRDYCLDSALWGFAAETGLHAVRLIMSGVFDRFPDLQIVLGHMGESLPFQLFRLDNVLGFLSAGDPRPPQLRPLERKPSEYFRSNFHVTTSGMFWDRLLQFGIDTVGADRIIFSIDYPYESTKAGSEWFARVPISAEEKRMIASGNAERLFHIAP